MGRKWDESDSRREEHLVMRDDDHGIHREERKAHRMSDRDRDIAARFGAIEEEAMEPSGGPLDLDALDEADERFFSDEEALDFGGDAGEGRASQESREQRGSRRDARDRR